MRFAKWTFRLAGLYGLALLTPFYFLEEAIGRASGAVTHPEYFYGFVGTALAMQLLFLLVSADPGRYRGAMPVAVAGKVSFGAAAWALWLGGRTGSDVVALATVDLAWAILFALAFRKTVPEPGEPQALPGSGN